MTLPPPQPQGHRLIELLTLEFAEAAYQRRSTSAGRARKSAFSAFATSLPRQAVKWARYVEDGRKTIVLSSWESGTYDADRSLNTIVKPLSEHFSGTQWSRQLVTLDSTSVDTMSSLWGPFNYELRILDFRVPDDRQQSLTEYWKEQEEKISKVLGTIRDTLTSFNRIGSMPPAVEELGYLGLAGGWVVSEDGAVLQKDSEKGEADRMSRKWAGILAWRDESGERKAWGEEGAEAGQECLQSLVSIPDGVGQRWHATKFEVLGDGIQRYAFSSSDDDDP